MQEVLVCNLPVRSGGLSNTRLDALINQAGIKRGPDNSFLRTKRDKCMALSMAGAEQYLKDVKGSEAFKRLGVNKVAAASRVTNSLTEVKHSLEDAQEKLLKAEPPVPCDANAAGLAEEWHQALLDTQNRLAEIKRMHGKTLGLAQTGPDRQRLIAEMKANQYQIKTALIEVTEKLQQTQSTAEQLKSPAMTEQAGRMNRVREALGEEVSAIDDHIKEVKSVDTSDVEKSTTKDCHEVCAGAEQALSRTRAMLKAYTDRLPAVQDADRLIKMRDALEARAERMKEVMRTADNTVDRVLNRLGALDGEVRGLDGVIDSPSKLAKLFRSIDALMVQHDEAVADAASAQRALKDAHSSLQSLQKDLAELVRMTGERVDASELADSAEMIAKLKRHISGSGGLAVALSSAQDTHTELASQDQVIEGRLATILQGLDKSLNISAPQHGGGQESILQTIEEIEQRMAALIKERDRTQLEMQGMTTKFQSDMNLRTKEFNDRLTAMQQENKRVLERVHDVVERMDANNQAMRGIAESIPNVDSQTIASVTNEQVSLLEDLREAEALLNHSTALQHKIAYEASSAATPIAIDTPSLGQEVPAELSVASLQRVHDDTRAAIGERDALVEKLTASVSRENELKSQPDSQNLAEEVAALRGEIGAIEQKIADQETHIKVQSDIISKLPQEVKKLEDGDGAAKEKLVAIESGLWDRVSQKDAALEAIDHERNLQDSVDRETLRARTDAMIAENNDRLRQITTTLESLKREIETGADPARIAALQDERERTRRAQELHLKFDTSLREHKADAEVPVQTGLDAGSHLTHLMPSMSDVPASLTPQDSFDQQRAVLERYQEEFAHQKQEIDRLSAQEAVNAQLHDQYNALKQQAETVSNQLIELLAPFGGNADALRSLVAEYAASNQRTRELTSENEQLREDLAATHRTMAEEYDRRIQQLQQELTEAQRREAAAKVDTLETRRRADEVAQDLKLMQDSTVALQGLPVLRFDEHHTISSLPAQAVRDIVKDYTFLRDDYGIVQGETRDRIVAILESLNNGSSVLDPDALPTHENESPEVLKRRLQVYQESVRATMSKQLEAKKEEARLLALAYDATAEHDELLRSMRKIPAPAGSIQDIGQQLTLVEAFIREVTRGHAGQGTAPSGLDSISAEDLQHFRDDLVEIESAAELMAKIGGKALDDIQAAVTAFALQHGILGAQLAAVPEWQELQEQTGERTTDLVRATLLNKIQAMHNAADGAESFYGRLRAGRDSLAPVQKIAQDAREMVELILKQLSYPNQGLGVDKLKEAIDTVVASLKQTAPQGNVTDLDGMLGGASSIESLSRSISQTFQDLISPVNTFVTAWYSLVAEKPIPTGWLITPPTITASTDPATPAPGVAPGVAPGADGVISNTVQTSPADVSRLLAALISQDWLNDHDFIGTERVTADKQPQILQKMGQYGRCMDAQRRAWRDVTDDREAIKCFYLGDILKRYDLLSIAQPTMSVQQGNAVIESLWPKKTQAGGAAVDWQSIDPYDVRKLNTLLISLNKIVMDRMKDLGEVSTLRADNMDFKVRYAALNEALKKKQDFAEKLVEITRQSIERALSSEEILVRDDSVMDDMKLFLLGKGPNDTFNSGRNVLKKIDSSLDWSGSVSDATEEVVSFRDKSKIRSWFSMVKKRITQDELHRALQSMVSCARFLVSSSAFTEEDDMLTEIHEIRRNLKEHLEALKAPYDDTFFDHIKDLKDINETWFKVLQDERQTRQLRDFENQILGVLTSQSSSKGPDSRRVTLSILNAMLATIQGLQGLVTTNPACRTYVGDLEAAVKSGTETYRASNEMGADVRKTLLQDIKKACNRLNAAATEEPINRASFNTPPQTSAEAEGDSRTYSEASAPTHQEIVKSFPSWGSDEAGPSSDAPPPPFANDWNSESTSTSAELPSASPEELSNAEAGPSSDAPPPPFANDWNSESTSTSAELPSASPEELSNAEAEPSSDALLQSTDTTGESDRVNVTAASKYKATPIPIPQESVHNHRTADATLSALTRNSEPSLSPSSASDQDLSDGRNVWAASSPVRTPSVLTDDSTDDSRKALANSASPTDNPWAGGSQSEDTQNPLTLCTKIIEDSSGIPPQNKTKIRNAYNGLIMLYIMLPIPDAVMAVLSGIDGPNCTWKEGTETKLDDLQKECVSLYQQVRAEHRSPVRKLWRSVEDMIVTRTFLKEVKDHDKKERELMWADLSGPQTAALTSSLQSVLQAMDLSAGGARPQMGGGNLVETAADSLRTLFENVNAMVNLLKPGTADSTPDSAPTDASPFDPDRFLQRIAGLSDDEATEMVKKLKMMQESLRMQLLADPSATQPTEAGILNLVLHQAISYIELRQSCSQRVADLHKEFEEQMQDMQVKCAEDVSRADKEALQAKKALVDAESSDVPLSPSDIVYAFRSVPEPRAHAPEVRIPQTEATARVIDTQGKSDGTEAPPIYETSPDMPSDVAPPPPLYTTTSQDMPPDVAPPPPLYSVVDTAQGIGPTESVAVHDPSETPLAAVNLVSSTHQDALPRGDQVHSPLTDSTDSNTTHRDEQTPATHETQRFADILQEPVDSEATALLQPPTLDTASSIPQEPDAAEQRPVVNQIPAAHQTGDTSERISSPSLVLSEPVQPTAQPDSDRADVESLEDTRRPPEMMYPLPVRMNPLISAESPSGRSDRLPEASLVYPTLSEQLDAQAPDPGAASTGYAPVTSPQPTAPASTFLAPARVVSPTQQGRKLEVVSDKDLAGLRAFDWRSLATSVGTLVRHKLGEPGSVAPELLPPSASGMTGGADTGADWKRDLFSASLACYVMHAILMRTPEIIRMVSLTETDPDGKSDTFTQAILNHSGKDTALCRAFLDAVFVDVSAMRLPEDRVTSALHGFLSAIDRDSAIGSAQWLTLGEPELAQRRCVRVDDFFKYSCLLLRALTESQSDRSENQDDMYRDALYVIGQVVRTRSEALSDPLNSLNLDAYRRVPTLNLGELKESHSRSGRAGVLTYLKFRNDVADSWNQRMYPSWNDEHFGTEVYMQFNNHPFPYYDRATKEGNVMPMVDNSSIQRWGLKSVDGRSVDTESYRYHYLLGPFTRVFGPADDAAKIARESTDIKKSLLAGESMFLIGYGASGAGKTSTLICRSGSRNNCAGKDSGVLLNVLQDRDIASRFPTVSLTVCEFLAGEGDPGIADAKSKKIADVSFRFSSGVYLFDAAKSATSRYEGRWSPANSLDLTNDLATLQPYNLSKVIAHTIDTDRLVKATTNNPNSSRSHVLVFIRLDPDSEGGPCLIVGDFAGVENEFVCDSVGTLMQIYNQRDSAGQRMYTPKDLQTDRENKRLGRCNLPASQRGGAGDDFVLYNDETLDTQAVLARQKDLMRDPGLLERLCGHPLDGTLSSSLTSKLGDMVRTLEGAYPVNRAKSDVSRALGAATAEREEAMYMAGDSAARVDGILPGLQSSLVIASSAALWNSKRDADNTPAIDRALTILKGMYKPETAAVQARKNEPQWKGKVTNAVELDMLAFEVHSSRPGSVLGVLGVDAAGFGSHPRTSPKTPASDGAISWLDKMATKFGAFFKVIKQAFPDKVADVAEILLTSWLAVHFAEFQTRDETLMSMRSVCACRTHEGVFINDSLGVIRDVIRDLVQHQQASRGRLMMAPAFSDMCLPLYCNPLAESCWGSNGRSDDTAAADVILGRDRTRTRVMSAVLDVIGSRAAERLRVAVFCIVLMNRSENNDPMAPFIDAEDLRIELARIEKSNRNSVVKRMLTDGWKDVLVSYNQLSDPPTVNQGVIDAIKSWITLLAPQLGQGLAQRMVSMADASQTRASKLLTMLDRVNAVHPVGTLQFIDSLAKYNLTDAMCRFSCDSKITFARSLFERVLQSLENGQLGDYRSLMEDNLRMREYLRPPRDPVAASTYDAAAKGGWLGEKHERVSGVPVNMTAMRTTRSNEPKTSKAALGSSSTTGKLTAKRPVTSQMRYGGGLPSAFNPCTVDEFLMQWATAVSERIANGEEPVRGAMYSDFLQSCEERKRAEKGRTRGFKSLDALIGPMQDTHRSLPRRRSRRAR